MSRSYPRRSGGRITEEMPYYKWWDHAPKWFRKNLNRKYRREMKAALRDEYPEVPVLFKDRGWHYW